MRIEYWILLPSNVWGHSIEFVEYNQIYYFGVDHQKFTNTAAGPKLVWQNWFQYVMCIEARKCA